MELGGPWGPLAAGVSGEGLFAPDARHAPALACRLKGARGVPPPCPVPSSLTSPQTLWWLQDTWRGVKAVDEEEERQSLPVSQSFPAWSCVTGARGRCWL